LFSNANWAKIDNLKEGDIYTAMESHYFWIVLEGFKYWHSHKRFQLHKPIAHLSQQGAQC